MKYIDPDGNEIAIGAALGLSFLVLATYYTLLNYYQTPEVQEANKQLADSVIAGIDSAKDTIRNALSKSKNKKIQKLNLRKNRAHYQRKTQKPENLQYQRNIKNQNLGKGKKKRMTYLVGLRERLLIRVNLEKISPNV